ncbi:MAG: NAD(+) kinase [Thiogranum sp.]|nr:NAD(+) kinase [Thiogranum sp.]
MAHMSNPLFRTIGLIAKHNDVAVAATLTRLRDDLQGRDIRMLLDESAASYFPQRADPVASREMLARECDLVIVVGGDGTMLNAARSMAGAEVPVLGVNLGRLGFLADVSPLEMRERLDEILAGHYAGEHRSLLHAEVWRQDEMIAENDALNDVVIHKWDIARMVELEVCIDGRFLYALRADGLIVSTPTGSTAYALSGGGPIIDPALAAVVLVPICPHTLSNRPIVVSDQVVVEILVHGSEDNKAQITWDGQVNLALATGDRIRIRRKTQDLRLLHPLHHDHFEVMRKKLRWAEQP